MQPGHLQPPRFALPDQCRGFSRLVAQNRELGASCVRRSGRLLRYLDARYVARDIERVRRALRDGKLNFLGLSYGKLIGLEYANLYPRRIRTMALDGLLNDDVPELEAMSDKGAAYERALNRFFAWCDATPECALYGKGARRRGRASSPRRRPRRSRRRGARKPRRRAGAW